MFTKRKKLLTGCFAILLALFIGMYFVVATPVKKTTDVRTIVLEKNVIDAQSVLNEFENSKLTQVGTTTYFEGYKSLTADIFNELDNVSEQEISNCVDSQVKYNFSYDLESNIVTLSAVLYLQDGTVEVDEISGVGFINDNGEVDAVMNIDGEGILISEMRELGMIENCGWFSRLFRKVVKAVSNVVAKVAKTVAVAAVVATTALAVPALIGATVVLAPITVVATIGLYASITAAIAAGVVMTVELWEKYYPGINVTIDNGNVYTSEYEKAIMAIIDIVAVNQKSNPNNPKVYFKCIASNNLPSKIELKNPLTCSDMAFLMQTTGTSSVTHKKIDAQNVMVSAASPKYPVFIEPAKTHFHAVDIFHPAYDSSRQANLNPRWTVNGNVIHSFWVGVV